jgi:hypothetical protein
MPEVNHSVPAVAATSHLPVLSTAWQGAGRSARRFLAPLNHAIASWHHHFHQGRNQVVIRFHNGYGAIFSEYRLLERIYEIAPLRFHGPGPYDYDFYFRSHVADLTWCSDQQEILRVCAEIARLQPPAAI